MRIINNKRIQDLYKKEAESLIRKIKIGLSSLNAPRPTVHGSRSSSHVPRLFHLFRYAHTLKGISGTCGKYKIEAAAKSITEIFRAAKDGEIEINAKDKVMIKKKLKECEKLLRRG